MYSKFQKNFINEEILNILFELNELNSNSNLQNETASVSASKLSSIASNEIEGITLNTNNQKQKTEAKIYIENYNQILKYIKNDINIVNLTNSEILNWHNFLFKNTLKQDSCGGKFKTGENAVVDGFGNIIFKGAPPWQTPMLMEDLLNWYNKSNLPALIKIIIFNSDFLMIHPFNDGNGRISRLLMNYLLIKEGYTCFKYISLENIILNHKTDYLTALKTINQNWNTENCDYSKIIMWFLKIFKMGLLQRKEKFSLSKQFEQKQINKTQLIFAVIKILNNQNALITRQNIINFITELKIDISPDLIKKTLSNLVSKNVLQKNSQSKKTNYEILEPNKTNIKPFKKVF